jgi:heme/copper-type cytochrome/quinol oxidase subunit 2
MGICASLLTLPLLVLVLSSGRADALEGPRQEGQSAQAAQDSHREVAVAAKHNGFTPARLEVQQNDLIKVTFTAEDAPHTFNIDEYRIAKRARPGHPAVFEFRADRPGKFPYYCNLSAAGDPHNMRGELVVVAK